MSLRSWRAARIPLLVSGLACAGFAHAGPPIEQRLTPAQMHETGLDTLQPAQLALLNRLLEDSAPATPAAASTPATTTPAATTGEVRPLAPDPTAFAGAMDGPQKVALVGTLEGWQPGTVFALSNGQQWQVLKGEWRLARPLNDAGVTLVPGVMGRWFLQVDDNIPMARIQRIR